MNGIVHIIGQNGINLPLPIDPRFSGKTGRDYFDPKMRLATFTPASMAMMFVCLVDDPQLRWLKSFTQLTLETIGNLAHGTTPHLPVATVSASYSIMEISARQLCDDHEQSCDGYVAMLFLTSGVKWAA
jgi:hypothetical protein